MSKIYHYSGVPTDFECLLLRKSQESFDTEIMRNLRKFQYWGQKYFLLKKNVYSLSMFVSY